MAHPQHSPLGHLADRITGQSPAARRLRTQIRHLAPFDAPGEALARAQELAHPFSLAFARHFAARMHQLRREARAAQEQAAAAIALSREQGFAFFLAVGTIVRGWALAAQGQTAEGIAQIQQGLAAHRATGAGLDRAHHLALLAEAYGRASQAGMGLEVLAEALAEGCNHGERYYEAELYRMQGQLRMARAVECDGEAEACFQQALQVARRQKAKSLELRAAISLSRLWQQGKRKEARQLLDPIYRWFTEGFDTADLQEAKALLDELS